MKHFCIAESKSNIVKKYKVEFCPKSEMAYLKITNKKIEIFFLTNSIGIQTPIF